MGENQLSKDIKFYRKKRGLSQENLSVSQKISMGKMPWIFIGISILSMIVYIISSVLLDIFSMGTLICMFVLCTPIQLFLHIYFSNAINNNSFSGIAGFDDKIEYNIYEVKKMLVQINLHIGMMTTVYVFLICVINCMNEKLGWLNGFLIVVYSFNFVITVQINNYKMIDKIYCKEDDKKRARRSMPITIIYILLLFAGIGMAGIIFEIKGIENNSGHAIRICTLLLLGIIVATIGFIMENNKIKKWNFENVDNQNNKGGILSIFVCVIIYAAMCVV